MHLTKNSYTIFCQVILGALPRRLLFLKIVDDQALVVGGGGCLCIEGGGRHWAFRELLALLRFLRLDVGSLS